MTTTTHDSSDDKKILFEEDIIRSNAARTVLGVLRIAVGFLFLWAFIDKTFGLGFSTAKENAWINGGAPAQGFLKFVASGSPFSGFFNLFANPLGDWLFMLGMLGIGLALVLGMGLKVAAVTGVALMVMMYMAEWPVQTGGTENAATNPLVDSHWIEGLSLILFALTRAGDTLGLGRLWALVVGDSWLR